MAKIKKAMKDTVDLEPLSTKLFGQFQTFIQKKVRVVSQKPCYTPKSQMQRFEQSYVAEESKDLAPLSTLVEGAAGQV